MNSETFFDRINYCKRQAKELYQTFYLVPMEGTLLHFRMHLPPGYTGTCIRIEPDESIHLETTFPMDADAYLDCIANIRERTIQNGVNAEDVRRALMRDMANSLPQPEKKSDAKR